MKIIIHCYAKPMRNNKENPKNYPYWKELVKLLTEQGHEVIQVGLPGEYRLVDDFRTVSFEELKKLINTCDTWIDIDSFFQHLAWVVGKKGIVLFGPSDPNIFGHKENINLYADKKYFRPDQFGIWEHCEFNENAFVKPQTVVSVLEDMV
jgi:ADP-heptose:LPS heptosyltransferase